VTLTESEDVIAEEAKPPGPVVDFDKVSKEYLLSGKTIKALDDVSCEVSPDQLVVLLGPSGAGKTTILNLIAGLEKPSSGDVRVLGMDIASSDENALSTFRCANVGFIFQSYNLVSTLTARENVELMMELAGWSDAVRNEKLTGQLIDQVGLTDRGDHLPSQLSGGEQQRVAIARALANDPQLILADEPTGNLDTKTGSEIIGLLQGLKKDRGKTVIITTHDERIVQMADAVYRIDKGRLMGIDRRVSAGSQS
jgi:putative ABC transport system ATP-binding protein